MFPTGGFSFQDESPLGHTRPQSYRLTLSSTHRGIGRQQNINNLAFKDRAQQREQASRYHCRIVRTKSLVLTHALYLNINHSLT